MPFDWTDRPCLVTGGAGFGGAHLCALLDGLGARVISLDREYPHNSYLFVGGAGERVLRLPGDIRDLDRVSHVLERHAIDTVFHLAAQPLVPQSNVLPLETLEINCHGTCVLLEAMRRSSGAKRMIFASSGAYYGAHETDALLVEEDPPRLASNIYSPSKAAADLLVRSYGRIFGLEVASCRFMNTYGPGDTNFSRLVPKAARHLLRGTPYDFGDRDDGTTRLDFLHIRDMSNAYRCVAESLDRVAGEAFNFGSGQATDLRWVVRKLSQLFDGKERQPRFGGAPRQTPLVKALDATKARKTLGWSPKYSLEQGLGETLDWYREHIGQL